MYDSNKKELDLSEIIQQFHVKEEIKVANKFKELIKKLPPHLIQWDKWFTPVYLNSSWKEHYKSEASVKSSQEISKDLINYALTPISFYSSIYGFKLLLNELTEINTKDIKETKNIKFQIENKEYELSIDLLTSFIDNTVPEENKKNMIVWILAVLEVEPKLIPEYEFIKQGDVFIIYFKEEIQEKESEVPEIQKFEGLKIIDKENEHILNYPYREISNKQTFFKRNSKLYEIKEDLLVQLYGIAFMLYFIVTLLLLPFEILYSYTVYTVGKWCWKIKGKKNNYDYYDYFD